MTCPDKYKVTHITSEPDSGFGAEHFPIEESSKALERIRVIMDNREKKLAEEGLFDWSEFVRADTTGTATTRLVIVDSLERVVGNGRRFDYNRKASHVLSEIMHRGRSLGIHLVATTQDFTPGTWATWEERLAACPDKIVFTPRGCGRAMWYSGREPVSPQFSVHASKVPGAL